MANHRKGKYLTDVKKGDKVRAYYKGSAFVGTATTVSEKDNYAEVRFAPGVTMILALQDVHLLDEQEEKKDD